MNEQEIDSIAKRAGFSLESWMTNPPRPAMWHGSPEALLTFYEEGFRAGMERAAAICSARVMGDNNREDGEAKQCAAAIRAETVSDGIHRQV